MAWTNLPLPTAAFTIARTGVIGWDAAVQIRMGDPAWVDLMWDASEQWLGVRKSRDSNALPVIAEPELLQYTIDAADVLDLAGITIAEKVTGEPELSSESPSEGGEGWVGHGAIYYLALA